MRTQSIEVGQGSASRDEINSVVSSPAHPKVQSKEPTFSETASAVISLTSVVQALSFGEMAVALYASDAAIDLLVQDLTVGEIETLACQGLFTLELRMLRYTAFHLFEGEEQRVSDLFSDETRLEAAANQAQVWDGSSRGFSVGRESFGLEGTAA